MSCSTLQDNHYEAFLVYSSTDDAEAEAMWNSLHSKGLKITFHKDPHAFPAGRSAFENMANAIENSDKTLIYLTKAALDSGYVCLEIMLALEKTQRTGNLCLYLIAEHMQEEQIKGLKRGLLDCVPHINVDTNKEHWEEKLISRLRDVSEKRQLRDVLPVGNLAHGQVFSHYCGYLQHILPVLEAEIKKHELYKQNPNMMCMRYFMLIPFSCNTETGLEGDYKESGISIKVVGSLKILVPYAGKQREYAPTIYEATKGQQSVYFVGEFPNVLNTVYQIQKRGIAKVDTRLEAQRFFHTMNHLLNHRLNPGCNDKCVLLPYADEKFSCAEVLWEALSEELQKKDRTRDRDLSSEFSNLSMFSDEESTEYDVSISCLSDDPADREVADSIAAYLEDKNKNVTRRENIAGQLDQLRQAKRNIFIMSKHSFEDDIINIELVSAIFKCAEQNHISFIPVVNGMDIDEVPISLKWVTMLSTKEKELNEILLKQIEGRVVHMQEKMPAGDVSSGLGWSYLLNYLPLQLAGKTETGLDFHGRMKQILYDMQLKDGCLPHFYIIVASDGSNINQEVEPISFVNSSEPIVQKMQAGTKDRKYYFRMYKYTFKDSDKAVCYVSEVCTPGLTLNTMATKLKFAGIDIGEELRKQIRNLASLIEGRLQESHYKDHVGDFTGIFRLIRYDKDGKKSLSEVIGSQLKADINNSELIYADQKMEVSD